MYIMTSEDITSVLVCIVLFWITVSVHFVGFCLFIVKIIYFKNSFNHAFQLVNLHLIQLLPDCGSLLALTMPSLFSAILCCADPSPLPLGSELCTCGPYTSWACVLMTRWSLEREKKDV